MLNIYLTNWCDLNNCKYFFSSSTLKIVEETSYDESLYKVKKPADSKQLLIKQDRTMSMNSSQTCGSHINFGGKNLNEPANMLQQLQHLKLSPSKSMSNYSLSNKLVPNKNSSHTDMDMVGSKMPTKDSVIRKMKKITKAVQELFKATKDSEFVLSVYLFNCFFIFCDFKSILF